MTKQNSHQGTAFSRGDSLMLLFLAGNEKIVITEEFDWQTMFDLVTQKYPPALIKDLESEILGAALIYGDVHLLLPDYISQINVTKFEDEGVPVHLHNPYNDDELIHLQRIYAKTHSLARRLEKDYRLSRRLSYEEITQKRNLWGAKPIDFATMVSEYEYYLDLLQEDLTWVTQLSPELFSFFLEEMLTWQTFFDDAYTQEYFTLPEQFRRGALDIFTHTLMELMCLHLFDAEEIENTYGTLLDVFPNNFFEEFKNYDALWGEFSRYTFEDHAQRAMLELFCHPRRFSIVYSFWRTLFELKTLIKLSASSGVHTKLPARFTVKNKYPISHDEEKFQLYKLYVSHINSIPRVDNFRDFFRLYNHKYVKEFRNKLDEWNLALQQGNTKAIKKMERDFELATKDLSNIAYMQHIGNLTTIVSLPVGVAGVLSGLPLDFAFTAIGPALLGLSKWLERRSNWVKFGTLE